jgi:hypothetical protein
MSNWQRVLLNTDLFLDTQKYLFIQDWWSLIKTRLKEGFNQLGELFNCGEELCLGVVYREKMAKEK